jgi:hypothetical protein
MHARLQTCKPANLQPSNLLTSHLILTATPSPSMTSTEQEDQTEILVGVDFGTTSSSVAWTMKPQNNAAYKVELIE